MSTPSSRTRHSRVSSPYTGAPAIPPTETRNTKPEKSERPKTLLDRWIEPPLPAPRPSFAEHGIERHGVVLNMAPLGTRPSAKMMKSVIRSEQEAANRPSTKRAAASTVTTPGESTTTPEPSIIPTVTEEVRSETPEIVQPDIHQPMEVQTVVKEREETASPMQSISRSSIPPSQSSGQNVWLLQKAQTPTEVIASPTAHPLSFSSSLPQPQPVASAPVAQTPKPIHQMPYATHQSPYPIRTPAQTPTPSNMTPLVVPPLPMDADGLPSVNLELTDKIVEAAVQEALDRQKWPTAYALRTLYDDHRRNIRIVRLIEAIYNGRGDERDRREFRIIIRQKKKEGKKNRTGEYYFNGDGSDPAPAPQHIFTTIQAVVNPPVRPYQTPYSTLPPRPSSSNSVATESQAPAAAVAQSPAHPITPQKDTDEHVDKKPKTNGVAPSVKSTVPSKPSEPSEPLEVNGDATSGDATKGSDVNGAVHGDDDTSGIDDVMNDVGDGDIGDGDIGVQDEIVPDIVMTPSPSRGNTIKATPKRVRSNSNSTSSSLSSVDEQLLVDGVLSAGPSPARPLSKHLGPGSIGAGLGFLGVGLEKHAAQPRFVSPYANANNFAAVISAAEPARSSRAQPITDDVIPAAPKPSSTATTASSSLDTSSAAQQISTSTNAVPDNTTPTPTPETQPPSPTTMAPALLLSHESNSSSSSPPPVFIPAKFRKGNKNHSNGSSGAVVLPPNPEIMTRKRAAREISNSQSRNESSMRTPLPEVESSADDAPPPAKRQTIRLNVNTKKTKPYRTRNAPPEEEPDSSPTTLGFRPDNPPGSVDTSRAGTPLQVSRTGRTIKPAGSGLRLKSSPVKKKVGTSAGLAKESAPRSPVGNQEEVDNNDFCSGCGGNGDLVCCDGCIRSFHFKCVDPPLAEGALPDEWFCNKCQVKQQDDRGWPVQGKPFDQLDWWMADTNPKAFHLPKDIRDYFTDVKTGPEGEYEVEAAPPPPKGKKGALHEDLNIDYFRKRDSKGNPVLCYYCHLSASAPDRKIVPCSFCGLNWHLDCLPTPLAKEPNPLRQWRCPAHVDDLLATLPQFLGPAHRFRTIKGASVEIPAISRGFKNTGHIQIVNDATDAEDDAGFFETREFGKVYKLPEHGIVLDFISKVKQQGGGYVPSRFGVQQRHDKAWTAATNNLTSLKRWDQSDLEAKQAALNLAAMANSAPGTASGDSINTLVGALLTTAPPAAISLMAVSDVSNIAKSNQLSNMDRTSLLAMKEHLANTAATVDRLLQAAAHVSVTQSNHLSPSQDSNVTMTGTEGSGS